MDEPSALLHAASMHRTLAPFAELEPAMLLVFCTTLAWRRSFLSAQQRTAAHSSAQQRTAAYSSAQQRTAASTAIVELRLNLLMS